MPVEQRYLQIFLEEAEDLLQRLDQRLLRLEEHPGDAEALRSAMRLAHTLKGSARMVGLVDVSQAAHTLENLLRAESEREGGFSPESVGALLRAADGIRTRLAGAAGRPRQPAESSGGGTAPPVQEPRGEPPTGGRIRVSTERLDALQTLVDDLVIQEARIIDQLERFWRQVRASRDRFPGAASQGSPFSERRFEQFLEEASRLDQLVGQLQHQVLELRMVPLGDLLEGFRRTVRDLARELGKEVDLVIDGKLTEVDRRLLDGIQAPLAHLVRNAVDHGIEPPDERERAGKPRRGRLVLRAYHRPGAVVLEVEDDGRGLDPDLIRQRAVEKGLIGPDEADGLGDEETFYLLCEPGFSTRERADQVSGRGVGLDVVKVRVEKLKGSLAIQSEKGRFSRFRMLLPLSLSTLSVLVVWTGDTPCAVPSLFVEGCHIVPSAEVAQRGGLWNLGGRVVPVVSLSRILGAPTGEPADRVAVVVLTFRNRKMALQVDRLEGEREIVLKPLGEHLRGVPFLLGVSFLPTGEALPVLNVVDLYGRWGELEALYRFEAQPPRRPAQVLVVDDSVTTRHMEENLLRHLGFATLSASNGAEAWRILRHQQVDLVVTDLEMPGMDGLELSRRIRNDPDLAGLPIIVVSNRSSPADLEAARQAGANAYLRKDRFRQREFADAVRTLCARPRHGEGIS